MMTVKLKKMIKIRQVFLHGKKFNFQKVNNVLNTKKNLNILDIGSGKHFIEKIFPELKENNFFRLDLANREYVDIIADLQKDSYFKNVLMLSFV